MATLPGDSGLGSNPSPQPSGGVARVDVPSPRQAMETGSIISGAGGELQQAGQIIDAANAKQDSISAMDAANRLQEQVMSLKQDPDDGYSNKKGNDVVGPQFIQNYKDRFDLAQQGISDSLQNDRQKQIFQQHAQVLGLQYQSGLYQYQSQATQQFNQQTRQNTIDLAVKSAGDNPQFGANGANPILDPDMMKIGQAIVSTGKDIGLNGEALANFVTDQTRNYTSKALAYRTQAIEQQNPQQAADYFHAHEQDFTPQDRFQIGAGLKTSLDAQTSRIGGQQAYQNTLSSYQTKASGPMIPQDFHADEVGPLDQQSINNLANAVKKSGPYDALYQKYGQMYNVSPQELKLRAVVESGQRPGEVSDQGAVGLMQFTPDTAKRFGIDPKDPEQSIKGAALLMSQAGGTLGGDMEKVDRTYYGGNANARGPNTNQYAANLQAIRNQLNGGAPTQALTLNDYDNMEADVRKNARVAASQYRPGDMVLQDQWESEAVKNWARDRQALQQQNNSGSSLIMGEVVGGTKTLGDLSQTAQTAYSKLPPDSQYRFQKLLSGGDDNPMPQATPDTQKQVYQLKGMAADPAQRASFMKMDLMPFATTLPKSDFDSVMNLQMSLRNQDDKQQEKDINMAKARADTKSMIAPLLAPLTGNKTAIAQTTDEFNGRLEESLQDFKTQNQRNPNTDETRKLAASLLTKVVQPSGKRWYAPDIQTPSFQATEQGAYDVPVQTADKQAIQRAFQSDQSRSPSNDDELNRWHTEVQSNAMHALGRYLTPREVPAYADAMRRAAQPQQQNKQQPAYLGIPK